MRRILDRDIATMRPLEHGAAFWGQTFLASSVSYFIIWIHRDEFD
jgi:hypothetical protein